MAGSRPVAGSRARGDSRPEKPPRQRSGGDAAAGPGLPHTRASLSPRAAAEADGSPSRLALPRSPGSAGPQADPSLRAPQPPWLRPLRAHTVPYAWATRRRRSLERGLQSQRTQKQLNRPSAGEHTGPAPSHRHGVSPTRLCVVLPRRQTGACRDSCARWPGPRRQFRLWPECTPSSALTSMTLDIPSAPSPGRGPC